MEKLYKRIGTSLFMESRLLELSVGQQRALFALEQLARDVSTLKDLRADTSANRTQCVGRMGVFVPEGDIVSGVFTSRMIRRETPINPTLPPVNYNLVEEGYSHYLAYAGRRA